MRDLAKEVQQTYFQTVPQTVFLPFTKRTADGLDAVSRQVSHSLKSPFNHLWGGVKRASHDALDLAV